MEESDKPLGENRISLTLSSGRLVWVTEFSYSETYACIMDGWPREETTDLIIQWSIDEATKRTPHFAPLFMIQPRMEPVPKEIFDAYDKSLRDTQHHLSKPPGPTLPSIRCITCLESEPMDKTFDRSHLKVLWFQLPFFGKPLSVVLPDSLHNVPWEQNARDFHY